jgi:integrase
VDPKAGLITFARYFAEWAQRQVWATGTDRAMRLAAGCVTFGDVPLKSLRRSHVEKWIRAMQTADRGVGKPRGLAPGTIKTRLQNVRTVLRAAVRDRVIVSDPSDGVTLPRQRRAEAAMVLPTSAQVRALLDVAEPAFRAFIALAAFAGLRLGEAAAVQLGDVNFLGRTLDVARQVQRGEGGKIEITLPKYGSERTVYLAKGLIQFLSVHVPLMVETEERWLFVGQGVEPPHQNTVGHRWRKTCKARRRRGDHAARLAALLRLRPDRPGLRRGDRAARPRPRQGDHDPDDVRAPLADRRGPYAQGRGLADR